MYCVTCGLGSLIKFAETPRDWDSDAYVDTAKTDYFECSNCKELSRCSYKGTSPGPSDRYFTVGRLTKKDIEDNASEGREWVNLARCRNIIRRYRELQKIGAASPEVVYNLLREWNPPGIQNRSQADAIEFMDFNIERWYPLEVNKCKALKEARARMNRILGI